MELTRGSGAAAAGAGALGLWALVVPPEASFDGRGLVCAVLAGVSLVLMERKAASSK